MIIIIVYCIYIYIYMYTYVQMLLQGTCLSGKLRFLCSQNWGWDHQFSGLVLFSENRRFSGAAGGCHGHCLLEVSGRNKFCTRLNVCLLYVFFFCRLLVQPGISGVFRSCVTHTIQQSKPVGGLRITLSKWNFYCWFVFCPIDPSVDRDWVVMFAKKKSSKIHERSCSIMFQIEIATVDLHHVQTHRDSICLYISGCLSHQVPLL